MSDEVFIHSYLYIEDTGIAKSSSVESLKELTALLERCRETLSSDRGYDVQDIWELDLGRFFDDSKIHIISCAADVYDIDDQDTVLLHFARNLRDRGYEVKGYWLQFVYEEIYRVELKADLSAIQFMASSWVLDVPVAQQQAWCAQLHYSNNKEREGSCK